MLKQALMQEACAGPTAATLTAQLYPHLAPRRSINHALAALANDGQIARIDRGLYVRVLQGRFGA